MLRIYSAVPPKGRAIWQTRNLQQSDQGSQFTSPQFTSILLQNDIAISMDGKGRAIDNVFIERLWRAVKYECLYLHRFEYSAEVWAALHEYFDLHNHRKLHQALHYKTPSSVFCAATHPASLSLHPIIHPFAVRRMGRTTNVDRSINAQLLPSALLLSNRCWQKFSLLH